jgi:SAM-dependent methyltransferase
MSSSEFSRNAVLWTRLNAEYTDGAAEHAWSRDEITWGIWALPEAELGVLPALEGLDVVELGCGTAYFSSWLARRGARPVGVDPTPAQLESARRMQERFGLSFPLVSGPGEAVPLPDASFDLVVSVYGASIWADPYRWVPEAARLLRPGGLLVFLRNSTLVMLCFPDVGKAQERLLRPQFGMYRVEWPDSDGAVEFHLSHGEWIDVLRANGFEIERLVELQARADSVSHDYYDDVPLEWGRQWPAEEIWRARKTG